MLVYISTKTVPKEREFWLPKDCFSYTILNVVTAIYQC
jgi:hypothetical protein